MKKRGFLKKIAVIFLCLSFIIPMNLEIRASAEPFSATQLVESNNDGSSIVAPDDTLRNKQEGSSEKSDEFTAKSTYETGVLESEPNDEYQPQNATLGILYEGALSNTDMEDWYSFVVPEESNQAKIWLGNLPAAYEVSLYYNGVLQGSSSGTGTEDRVLYFDYISPGTFKVKVYPSSGVSPVPDRRYQLRFVIDFNEANNSITDATPLAIDQTVYGTVEWVYVDGTNDYYEDDYFRLPSVDKQVLVELYPQDISYIDELFGQSFYQWPSAYIDLFDASGNPIDYSEKRDWIGNSKLALTLSSNSTYYIRVRNSWVWEYSGSYRISVSEIISTNEPNNDQINEAVPISLDVPTTGYIETVNDTDFYQINPLQDTNVLITLRDIPYDWNGTYDLQLLDSQEGVIASSENSGTHIEDIRSVLTAGQTYYLNVSSTSSLFDLQKPYTVEIISNPGADPSDTDDAGDTIDTALQLAGSQQGYISGRGDVDVYTWTAAEDGEFAVIYQGPDNYQVDMIDAEGSLYSSYWSGDIQLEKISALQGEEVKIKIYSPDQSFSTKDPYTIKVIPAQLFIPGVTVTTFVENLDEPYDLVFDSYGNLFVSDSGSHVIWKIDNDGNVSVFAGSPVGDSGHQDGVGTETLFDEPKGLAIDSNNNLFVADYYNSVIRMITPDGTVSTIGVVDAWDYEDGNQDTAQFDGPSDVAVDAEGNLYVADTYNDVIRKLTRQGDGGWNVTTFAGVYYGNDYSDGLLNEALFDDPTAIAVGPDDALYVAEEYHDVIRKIKDGSVNTLAGTDDEDLLDGQGTQARFEDISSIAVDADGYVYVSEESNNDVRRISPDGTVESVAGTDDYDYIDGDGKNARFDEPMGITIGLDGNLYIADTWNYVIRQISLPTPLRLWDRMSPTTTLVGEPTLSEDRSAATLIITGDDTANGSLDVVGFEYQVQRKSGVWGEWQYQAASNAETTVTESIKIPLQQGTNYIYIRAVDTNGNKAFNVIDMVTLPIEGQTPTPGPYDSLEPNNTLDTAATINSAGTWEVESQISYYNDQDYFVFTPEFDGLYTITLDNLAGDYELFMYNPLSTSPEEPIASSESLGLETEVIVEPLVANQNYYLLVKPYEPDDYHLEETDNYSLTISKTQNFDTARIDYVGTYAGNGIEDDGDVPGSEDGDRLSVSFSWPYDLTFDFTGNLYIVDAGKENIRKIDRSGFTTTLAGWDYGYSEGIGTEAEFRDPMGIVADKEGNLYVADADNDLIRKITPEGVVSTIAGVLDTEGFADGPGREALFDQPRTIAIDHAGNLYVGDYYNTAIRKLSLTNGEWQVTTIVGGPNRSGYQDGPVDTAKMGSPTGIVVQTDGTIFFSDQDADAIRMIRNGQVSTLAGGVMEGYLDGIGSEARFDNPAGLAIDQDGFLYVADKNNSVIRRVDTNTGQVTTLAGTWDYDAIDSQDGSANEAIFFSPVDLAFGPDGALYVVDEDAYVIRRVELYPAVSLTDTWAPEVTIADVVPETDIVGDQLTLHIIADDSNSGMNKVSKLWVSQNWGPWEEVLPSSVSEVIEQDSTVTLKYGENTFRIQAEDELGNRSVVTANATISFNHTGLTAPLTTPAPGNYLSIDLRFLVPNYDTAAVYYSIGTPDNPPVDPIQSDDYLWDGQPIYIWRDSIVKAFTVEDGIKSSIVAYEYGVKNITMDGMTPKAVNAGYSNNLTINIPAKHIDVNTDVIEAFIGIKNSNGYEWDAIIQELSVIPSENGIQVMLAPGVPVGIYDLGVRLESGNSSVVYSSTFQVVDENISIVADPLPGTYLSSTEVQLEAIDPEAEIYYTTNGADPTTSSKRYTGKIYVYKDTLIKAITVVDGTISPIQEFSYLIKSIDIAEFSPKEIREGYTDTTITIPAHHLDPLKDSVQIAIGHKGDAYSLENWSDLIQSPQATISPDGSSVTFTLAAGLAMGEYDLGVKITTDSGYVSSYSQFTKLNITSSSNTFTASHDSGLYLDAINVELASTDGGTIYYTIDGSTPTINSNPYTDPIPLEWDQNLKAISVLDGQIIAYNSWEYRFIKIYNGSADVTSSERGVQTLISFGGHNLSSLDTLEVYLGDAPAFGYEAIANWSVIKQLNVSIVDNDTFTAMFDGNLFPGTYDFMFVLREGTTSKISLAEDWYTVNGTIYIEPEDLDGNGEVTTVDLDLEIEEYGRNNSDENWNEERDFNGDGIIDLFDLIQISKKIQSN